MHPNSAFRTAPLETNLAFARERGFGLLSVNGPAGPLAAHLPFVISQDGQTLLTHLVRSNPVAAALPSEALMAVSGPDSYVSPDWYGMDDQVPTWNYVAVHLRGRLELRPPEELYDVLERQTAAFEALLRPKPPWTPDKMPQDLMQRLMRAIVPCRMRIEDVQGTWKLAQNKPDEARLAAADQIAIGGIGSEIALLAMFMRSLT